MKRGEQYRQSHVEQAKAVKIDLMPLLEYVTKETFDYGHGLLPGSSFVVDAHGLLDWLREHTKMTKDQMHDAFDQARINVHGKEVDLTED
jgi:hypothetical protein